MNTSGWLQLAIFVGALALITKPMGLYLMRVLDPKGKTWLDPVIRPVERLSYWVMGVRPEQEQTWRQYTWAMLLFSLVSCVFTYAILRLQNFLPLNPQGFGALSPDLALVRGIRTGRVDMLFLAVLALAAGMALPVTGALLVFSLMIGPAGAACALARGPFAALALSVALALGLIWSALALSYLTDWPAGFFTGTLAAVLYVGARLIRR